MRASLNRFLFLLVIQATLFSPLNPVHSQVVKSWINTTVSPAWYEGASNWSPSGVPGLNDTALFAQTPAYQISWDGFTGNRALRFFELTSGQASFVNTQSTQYTLTVNGLGGSGQLTDFQVRYGGTGTLNPQVSISGLQFHSLGGAMIGPNATGSFGNRYPTLSVASGGLFTVSGSVGLLLEGRLNLTSGGDVTSTTTQIGGTVLGGGSLLISGTGSSLTNSGSLRIGDDGIGNASVLGGGSITSSSIVLGSSSADSGTLSVSGSTSSVTSTGSFVVGSFGTGAVTLASSATLTASSSTLGSNTDGSGTVNVTGNANWTTTNSIFIGSSGQGTLTITGGFLSGGTVVCQNATIGRFSTSNGTVNVSGSGAKWTINNDLVVGDFGTGTLNLGTSGIVEVGGNTTIGSSSLVNLTGGTFDFGTMDSSALARIVSSSGTLRGTIQHSSYTNVSSLTDLTHANVVSREVVLSNTGTLYGQASLGSTLANQTNGEVEVSAGERMRFGSNLTSVNAGEINNYGGIIRFDGAVTNQTTGFVAGRGQFIANGGWTNQGTMAFSGGNADVLGDVSNPSGGLIVTTSGSATTTFFDDVVNNGTIRTSQNADSVFLGSVSGSGNFTGTGTVYFEGDLRPGNSPGIVTFGGDVVLGDNAVSYFEFGGKTPGEFDQLQIAGDVFLNNSTLNVSMLKGFSFGTYQKYLIAAVQGTVNGQFGTYGEGAQLGNSNLFITYAGFGTLKGIGLYTKDLPVMWGEFSFGPGRVTAVPEPSCFFLISWVLITISVQRKRHPTACI